MTSFYRITYKFFTILFRITIQGGFRYSLQNFQGSATLFRKKEDSDSHQSDTTSFYCNGGTFAYVNKPNTVIVLRVFHKLMNGCM